MSPRDIIHDGLSSTTAFSLVCCSLSLPSASRSSSTCTDYRHQDDEGVSSRGAISLKGAILKHNDSNVSSDRLRFEIQSAPRSGSTSGQQKWHIKGNHLVEVTRWVQAISKSIAWYKTNDQDLLADRSRGSESETDGRSLRASVMGRFGSISGSITRLKPTPSGHGSTSSLDPDGERDYSMRDGSVDLLKSPVVGSSMLSVGGDTMDEPTPMDISDVSSDARSQRPPPHESTFMLQGNSIIAQMEVSHELCRRFDLPPALHEAGKAAIESFATVQRMMQEYIQMVHDREDWWKEKLDKERERNALWEESLQIVVQEGGCDGEGVEVEDTEEEFESADGCYYWTGFDR